MAQQLLHGVIDAKILEATLSETSDGRTKPAASKNKKKSKLVLCQSQNLMMRKVLSLIKKLPLICNCQRFEKSSGLGQHAAGKRLYATIGMDTACVVGRTRVVDAANDPQWKEEPLHIYCAHNASDIVFTVARADGDPAGAVDALVVGHAYLPVDDIVGGQQVDRWLPICDEKRKPLEGLDKIHVQLRFSNVSADPESRWSKGIAGDGVPYPGVPRTFFGEHRGCRVTLYQDAHAIPGSAAPPSGSSRCWEDIFDAITNARRLVYIAGWSVNTDVALVRDPRRPAQTLGQLLKKKAGERVTVLMLVWDTHGADTASYFRGTGVHCVLCPRNSGTEAAGAMFTHHQKAMVVDGPRGLVSFLGGFDLCGGRYDTQEHPLFQTLGTTHRDDFHQPSFPGASIGKGGPREPWHDVHCRVEGPAAWDVLDNFEQRWRKQGGVGDNDPLLVQLRKSSAAREAADQDAESWNVQVFRSIDSSAVVGFPETPEEAARYGLVAGKYNIDAVERSIQDAYIHAIRRAKYFIYIESHYFLGSSYGWRRDDVDGSTAENVVDALHLIPKELSLKIASKIKAGESFEVYVVLPMWPEGVPESASVQAILHWQRRTMEMMYKDVALALGGRDLTNNPKDYLSFFCLGNRESYSAGEYVPPERPELDSDYMRAQQARRFKINVHANMMIVDDEYIIVGSANINQRSMDGGRDSEMAMGAYQPRHLDTPNEWPEGQVLRFRLALWWEHLGQAAARAAIDDLLDPSNSTCMNKVNQVAQQHWDLYASDTFQGNLPGHLMAYPVIVGDRGELRETVAFFPDTKARVFGSSSANLAPILTT